ncbi:MAG: glycosyltransferase family 2 protein [Clostridia bacterium]|nr:glycosyltransferase family 2 protein [Clostridia bacterium]
MGNEIKISVIMPVYGVEKFVGKAIESIQKQTLQEWELFAVDDGTKDRSGIICDEYAEKDARIKVIHKENGGAPSARNVAIPQAKGKYMYFMDSDDWAEPTMLEDMYNLAEEHGAQYVVTGYFIDTYHSDTEYVTQELYQPDAVYSQQEFRENAYKLFDSNLLYTPWNKLYLGDYIREKGLLFPNTFWDDFPFNLSVIRDVEKVVVSSNKYYHFMRARAESETAKYRPEMYDKREEEHGWMTDLYQYWGVNDENSREFLARRYIERFIGCVENITNPGCTLSAKEKKAEIKKMLQNPSVKESLKYAKSKSVYMKLMLVPYKMNSTGLVYLESKVITFVKRRFTKLFTKLKAGR